MQWFFIALAAPFLWALVNLTDKYLVTNYGGKETSSGSLVLFSSLVGIVAAFLISIFTRGIFAISMLDKGLLIFIGAFSIFFFIFYLLSLKIEEVSTVVPWMLTIPVFGYVLGYLFLGETLKNNQFIGAIIIFFGALMLSVDIRRVHHILFKGKVALYMLISSFIYAINGVIFKFVASANSFWVASFWQYLGLGLGGIFIFVFLGKYRRDFISDVKKEGWHIFSIFFGAEMITIIGNLLTNYAILLAPVALVYMVGSFQPVAVLIMTFISTKFLPKIVSEDFSMKSTLPKMVAIFIMLIGGVVLFL
jgi:drug/metabolite transporter (DMT)-like permease